MKNIKKVLKGGSGFTLVELLIVITLIAILAVAVIATINPIEQAAKARDVSFKNDAAELLSSLERYYASQNNYPWVVTAADGTTGVSTAELIMSSSNALFAANDKRVGLVRRNANTGGEGLLVTSFEVKGSFAGKAAFKATAPVEDKMYVYTDGNSNNFVCYCPRAATNKTGTAAVNLKCLSNFTAYTTGVSNSDAATNAVAGKLVDIGAAVGAANCTAYTTGMTLTGGDFCSPGVKQATTNLPLANMQCVPEGSVAVQ